MTTCGGWFVLSGQWENGQEAGELELYIYAKCKSVHKPNQYGLLSLVTKECDRLPSLGKNYITPVASELMFNKTKVQPHDFWAEIET